MNKTVKIGIALAALVGAAFLWIRRGGGGGSMLAGSSSGNISIGEINNATTIAPSIGGVSDEGQTLQFGGKTFTAAPQYADFSDYMGRGVASANDGMNAWKAATAAWKAKFGG